jgi:hypothetical protein
MASPPRGSNKQQREPPPALFLHPSPSASHVSLPGILAPGAVVPGPGSLSKDRSNLDVNSTGRPGSSHSPGHLQRPYRALKSAESARSTDRTDALWAKIQATLEEVELSASGGTHVFGLEHDRKLADLRAAQIALAQAWARSEAEEAIDTAYRDNVTTSAGDELRNMKGTLSDKPKSVAGDGTEAGARSTAPSISGRPESSVGVDQLGAKLEQETEVDILLARRRREANDQYFRRVNDGVIDVVSKLEDVAVAMRAIEQETNDIWDGPDSPVDSAKT